MQCFIKFFFNLRRLTRTDFLPTIFHTATIWLTVALAAQRYLAVCRGAVGRSGSSGSGSGTGGSLQRGADCRGMLRVVGAVFTGALLFHAVRFTENRYGSCFRCIILYF